MVHFLVFDHMLTQSVDYVCLYFLIVDLIGLGNLDLGLDKLLHLVILPFSWVSFSWLNVAVS